MPMRLIRIVGARPQFMQAAVLRQELDRRGHKEFLVHTGQHYDSRMSQIFFDELEIPAPDVNLEIGSGSHARQTGRMMEAIERVLKAEPCDAIVVDGDTNSTLAGALTAVKLHIPVVHVEAGLRSFDRRMPEEINRIGSDHFSDLNCAPTISAMKQLEAEGLGERSALTGDLLHDCFLHYRDRAKDQILERLGLEPGEYMLCTVHRAGNTDDCDNLKEIVSALCELPKLVVFPVHPRTRPALEQCIGGNGAASRLRITEPVSYLEMLALEMNAHCILTDSGGVQREAFFDGVPSIILRTTTEWVEQLDCGWSILSGHESQRILAAYESLQAPLPPRKDIYGPGDAAEKITDAMEERLS